MAPTNSWVYLLTSDTQTLAINALAFGVRGIRGGIPPRHAKGVLECIADIVMSHPKLADVSFGEVVKEAVSLKIEPFYRLTVVPIHPLMVQ